MSVFVAIGCLIFCRPDDAQVALNQLINFDVAGIDETFNGIDWTPETIVDLQNALLSATEESGFCWNDHTHPVGGYYSPTGLNLGF